MTKETLKSLVKEGLTQRAIAERLNCSQSTVKYFLKKYELRTTRANLANTAKSYREQGIRSVERDCPKHGTTTHRIAFSGFHCKPCEQEYTVKYCKEKKEALVKEAGGSCIECGYMKNVAALHFHHRDPETKKFGISSRLPCASMVTLQEEAAKCDLLCANCHSELHNAFMV